MTTTNIVGGSIAHSIDARGSALGIRVSSITVGGARTTYVDEGSGPVVLLLHGAPVTSLAFVRVIRELSATNRVIAPDLPGFGGSEVPEVRNGFGGTLDEYASFVVEFVRALGLSSFVLYVNDASGCIGIAAATRFSPGIVRGMVVASTVPIPMTGAAWFVRLFLRYVVTSRVMRMLNRSFNLLPWMVACVAPWLHPFSKAERAMLTREFDTPEKRSRVLDLFEQMAVDKEFMRCTASCAREKLADTPTLILYGQFDPMRLIGGVARFRAMFPKSQVAIIPWEEHFPILASGAKVGSAVRAFMNSLPEDARE